MVQWTAAWRVFVVAMVMIAQATRQALEDYARNLERLAMLHPNCWHLIYTADDRCRSSHLLRIRRRWEAHIASGYPPPTGWGASPW